MTQTIDRTTLERRLRNLAKLTKRGVTIQYCDRDENPITATEAWDADTSYVQQQHDANDLVCYVTDLERYFTVTIDTLNLNEYWCYVDDTLDGVAGSIQDALLGEYAWIPQAVYDLDEGKEIAWDINIIFPT